MLRQHCAVEWELTGATEAKPGMAPRTTSTDSGPAFVDGLTIMPEIDSAFTPRVTEDGYLPIA